MGRTGDDDPLTKAMAPPPDETEQQKLLRLKEEAEARRISDEIDEQIKEEKAAMKKRKKPIKVLLLGQSESGQSTVFAFQRLTTLCWFVFPLPCPICCFLSSHS